MDDAARQLGRAATGCILASSGDMHAAAVRLPDGKIVVVDLAKASVLSEFDNLDEQPRSGNAGSERQMAARLPKAALSANGRKVAFLDETSGELRVYDWSTPKTPLHSFSNRLNYDITLSPNGSFLVLMPERAETEWEIIDLAGGKLSRLRLGAPTATTFSPSGRHLVVGSKGGQTHIVSLETGREPRIVQTLSGHCQSVRALALSPDGKRLYSGGDDEEIKVWDFEVGLELTTIPIKLGKVREIAVALNGRALVVGNFRDDAREVALLVVPDDGEVARKQLRARSTTYERGWSQAAAGNTGAARDMIETALRDLSFPQVDIRRDIAEIARVALLDRLAVVAVNVITDDTWMIEHHLAQRLVIRFKIAVLA